MGRLERRKGVDLLVQAMQQLERDDVRLTLLGGDTAHGAARQLDARRALTDCRA